MRLRTGSIVGATIVVAALAAGMFLTAAADAGSDDEILGSRNLLLPVQGAPLSALRDNFDEGRGMHRHEALDIMAPRGTPVVAVDSGRIAKLFRSDAGGITLYQFDRDEKYAYYYAHLDRYAEGIAEGQWLKRGDTVGYVGSTGNARGDAPHLHFTIFRLGADRKWWKGTAVNPYRYLAAGNEKQ
jgi:peptidoglycan LD-endopeptidase LytH